MDAILPPWPLLSGFLLASLLLAVMPGPGVLYIVTRSLVQGRASGLASAAGVALANLANALAASFGLAALFAVSSAAFTLVRLAGALYLVWLGLRMLLSRVDVAGASPPAPASPLDVFRDGVVVALFNPKTTIFFAAFLPQFLAPQAQGVMPILTLGMAFVAIAALTDACYAIAAGMMAPRLTRIGRRLGGAIFLGLGLLAAFAGDQRSR
ncbi:Threonine/homoserine/homoserine lactone efflux protein [Noviherbaspirillum humi]|uniref:Threonine/homoserine/homoserine lactone efflux protein n=1 Tax=Noviherbaspirillum humi TaxID=1688639 RepID=A0A239HPK9_9BURK|nr:LysE family translocator [Noviherbaspirillum humi]SNS83151.1 Threonine/homoserine/homoserine lactone efflux protein [Noviherbaspirillum humi]